MDQLGASDLDVPCNINTRWQQMTVIPVDSHAWRKFNMNTGWVTVGWFKQQTPIFRVDLSKNIFLKNTQMTIQTQNITLCPFCVETPTVLSLPVTLN